MRKTFNELVQEKSYNADNFNIVVDYKDVIKLLELCRLNTIQECANNAQADVNIFKSSFYNLEEGEDYEVYVLKESILQLDKNSIEI